MQEEYITLKLKRSKAANLLFGVRAAHCELFKAGMRASTGFMLDLKIFERQLQNELDATLKPKVPFHEDSVIRWEIK